MTEEEAARFLTLFCDYAESRGAWFPNGRPDQMPEEPDDRAFEVFDLPNPLTRYTV